MLTLHLQVWSIPLNRELLTNVCWKSVNAYTILLQRSATKLCTQIHSHIRHRSTDSDIMDIMNTRTSAHTDGRHKTYSVSQKNCPWGFLTFFPKRLGIFSPNFTCLLYVPIYARVQIFIQLSATLTKLCHIKCEHPDNFYISLEL